MLIIPSLKLEIYMLTSWTQRHDGPTYHLDLFSMSAVNVLQS